jgi:phosphoglycerate dehydrogenase-like enzyme
LPEEELGSLVRDFTGQAKFEQWNNPQVAPPWLDQVAVIYANERLDDDLLATMPNLKWVHFSRAGVNAYITPALNERPIQGTSSIGIHGVALAELGLASIFALATRLPECWEAQKRKEWSPGIVTEQIGGKTLGIIGLGTMNLAANSASRLPLSAEQFL